MADVAEVHDKISGILNVAGFEVHPFLVGWYNKLVQPIFHLPYNDDTLAFIISSTPAMFDKAFKPFICRQTCDESKDPIDECAEHYFKLIKEAFPGDEVETIHDFEIDVATRRPKILVQTAGHVAGAAYYYQRQDVVSDPWKENQKIYGVSIHPVYGGWFAFRGVAIFKNIHQPELPRKSPPDCVTTREERIKLLESYNYHAQDWTYRDVVEVAEKYSEEQKAYFQTPPKHRKPIIQQLKAGYEKHLN